MSEFIQVDTNQEQQGKTMLFLEGHSCYSGKWTVEEQRYVDALSQEFRAGTLDLPKGTSLRVFLANKLGCKTKRITKKFENSGYHGALQFVPNVERDIPQEQFQKRMDNLRDLEAKFKQSRAAILACQKGNGARLLHQPVAVKGNDPPSSITVPVASSWSQQGGPFCPPPNSGFASTQAPASHVGLVGGDGGGAMAGVSNTLLSSLLARLQTRNTNLVTSMVGQRVLDATHASGLPANAPETTLNHAASLAKAAGNMELPTTNVGVTSKHLEMVMMLQQLRNSGALPSQDNRSDEAMPREKSQNGRELAATGTGSTLASKNVKPNLGIPKAQFSGATTTAAKTSPDLLTILSEKLAASRREEQKLQRFLEWRALQRGEPAKRARLS